MHKLADDTAVVGLGSNLGSRADHIQGAIAMLDGHPAIDVLAVSSIVETEPLPVPDDVVDVGGAYLNAVALIRTTLDTRALVDTLLEIESATGRDRTGGRWSARPLDLDVLLHGNRTIDQPGVHVPHPRMGARWFVLVPMAELVPDVTVAGTDAQVRHLLHDLESHGDEPREQPAEP